MSEKNKLSLKLAHSLYDPQSIESAAGEFAELSEIAIAKHRDYTEVLIVSGEDENIPFEFLNYALFLTIQSK